MFIDTLADHATTIRFGESYGSYPVLRIHDEANKDLAGRLDGNLVAGKLPVEEVLQQMDLGLKAFSAER
ncbi:MAG: hypothetical protein ACI9F9_002500 [Candidatus Paceibacteria bacterium]